nr:MAG TPA: hypothetical protein [Caudoviricetes sp.]
MRGRRKEAYRRVYGACGRSEREGEGRISFSPDDFCKMNFRRSFRAKSFSRFGAFSK